MIDSSEIQQAICAIVMCDESEVAGELPLFSSGLVDSLSLLEIVVFLEKRYGIRISASELILDNFDSLQKITAFVARKLA